MSSDKYTFEFLVEYITAKIIAWIVRDQACSIEQAIGIFQNSETFNLLSDRQTDMYIESPAYVYDTLKTEFSKGTIRGMGE